MAIPTPAEVDKVVAAYNNAVAAAEYADSLVLEMQSIGENDNVMVWSTEYPSE